MFDVIVVGSGAGALTAALRADVLGAKVLVVEKSEQIGGSSAMSGGIVWIPDNPLMELNGVTDSPETAFTYLDHVVDPFVDRGRLRAFIRHGSEMVRFVQRDTHLRFTPMDSNPDYYQDAPGAQPHSRSLEPVPFDGALLGRDFQQLRPTHVQNLILGRLAFDNKGVLQIFTRAKGWRKLLLKGALEYLTDIPERLRSKRPRRTVVFGNALVGSLLRTLRSRDIPLWLNTPVVELEPGHGVVVEKNGERQRIAARLGVVLASGGFEANQTLRESYLPNPTDTSWSAACVENQGDAIRLGESASAAVDGMDMAWWGPTIKVPGEDNARMLIIEKALPGCCFVGLDGLRFANEAAPYTQVIEDMYHAQEQGRNCIPGFCIFGEHYRRSYPFGPLVPASPWTDRLLPRKYREEFLVKSDTLQGLAEKTGIDLEGLEMTIQKMNQYAATGVDQDHGRGAGLFDRYYGDASISPNPCLARIDPPYYAVKIFPGELGTKGGLVTDESARVLDTNGQPVAGLYATGNCTSSMMGSIYAGGGCTLGPAMTFGYIAANHLMAAADEATLGEH